MRVYSSLKHIAVVVAAACLLCDAAQATATSEIPSFTEATSEVPEDFEEVLYEEASDWVELFWHWHDTREVTQEMRDFRFTYEEHLPRGWTPFADAYALFEEIYAHRLQLDAGAGPAYYLDNLLRDDPEVLAAFREYTLTETLATTAEDPSAAMAHAEALVLRGSTQETMLFLQDPGLLIEEAGGQLYLVTRSPIAAKEEKDILDPEPEPIPDPASDSPPDGQDEDDDGLIEPVPCDLAPEACDFLDSLTERLWDSNIPAIEYQKDGRFFGPGFDCDDYVEAFWAWLKNLQESNLYTLDVEFESLWLFWNYSWGFGQGTKHGKQGHAVLIVKKDGYYYIVDPMVPPAYGPIPDSVPYEDVDWNDFLDDDFPEDNPDKIRVKHPTERPWNDPDPWHQDDDVRQDVEDETGNPAEDYIYPGN